VRGAVPQAPEGKFDVKAESDKPLPVSYAWVELGPEERESLGAQQRHEGTGSLWNSLAGTRLASAGRDRTYVNTYSNESKPPRCCSTAAR